MLGNFTIDETLNSLKAIFERHKQERICVIGTICVGKSTLCKLLSKYGCEDLDDVLFPNLPNSEANSLNKLNGSPWTEENGKEIYRIIHTYGKVKAGYPLFGSTILECETVVYLDISDELLMKHCEKRGDSFEFAKNYKKAIEDDWNNNKLKNDKTFYYLTVME